MKDKNENKFTTPEGYFDNFNERLFARIEAESDNEPNTDFLPKTDGLSVPQNYFEQVQPKILHKTLNNKESKVIQLNPFKKYYAVAAAIVILLSLATVFFLSKQEKSITFEDLAADDIDTYFDTAILDMSSNEITEVLEFETLSLDDISTYAIEDEAILEYLDEAYDDIDDINFTQDEIN
ncbi:hypothetical protein GCM10011414_16710 [Croceivirga lutea]|uniref:hypothetical protein n=1 Tax=Croceivirga lutea TaxID=1775167 RepID=UPI00163B17DB|nr:hypothetical protein [Croceivirga lutea]GGG47650.1 hypothetical protein GCM10011414_16710 [Croceivirga lutea]